MNEDQPETVRRVAKAIAAAFIMNQSANLRPARTGTNYEQVVKMIDASWQNWVPEALAAIESYNAQIGELT